MDTYNYYKGLIAFRAAHPALRMTSAEDVTNNITNLTNTSSNTLAFQINGGVNGEESDGIVVIFNSKTDTAEVELPEGEWTIYVNGEDAGTTPLGSATGTVQVEPISAMVLVKETMNSSAAPTTPDTNTDTDNDQVSSSTNPRMFYITLGICAAVVIVVIIVIMIRRRR